MKMGPRQRHAGIFASLRGAGTQDEMDKMDEMDAVDKSDE